MTSKLKTFTDGLNAAKHTVSLAVVAGAGVVSLTLLYAQVEATEEKAVDNETKIEAIKQTLQEVRTDQRVIIQRIDSGEENDKDFRNTTTRALERILDRVSTPREPIR